jgi:hypothetical protein
MAKLPSFQFYPGDWMKDPDLRRCTPIARGVYIDVLCLMHENTWRGILTTPVESAQNAGRYAKMARILCKAETDLALQTMHGFCKNWRVEDLANCIAGIDKRTAIKAINELINNNVIKTLSDGTMYNSRMIRDELTRLERADSGAKGGMLRQSGIKQNPSKSQAKAKQKGGSSSSSSSSNLSWLVGWFDKTIKPLYPAREGSNPWKPAMQACSARIAEGHSKETLLDGVTRYAAFCNATGKTGTAYVQQAKTFFGTSLNFLEPWTYTATQQARQSVKFPDRGNCPAWTAFAADYGIKPKRAELQVDFERRVRNLVSEKLAN